MDMSKDEPTLRGELAALCRLAHKLNWQEATANHISLATSRDGEHFLINRQWRDFSTLRASELVLLDSASADVPDDVDRTAWAIHGSLHRLLPQARCVVHVHPTYATALSCLKDPTLYPVDQATARFFNRVALDVGYSGMADSAAEGQRLAAVLGNKTVLMMGNHGLLVVGETAAEAFDACYHFERAARTLIIAYSSGQPLNILNDLISERTAQAWASEPGFDLAHFSQMRRQLPQDYLD